MQVKVGTGLQRSMEAPRPYQASGGASSSSSSSSGGGQQGGFPYPQHGGDIDALQKRISTMAGELVKLGSGQRTRVDAVKQDLGRIRDTLRDVQKSQHRLGRKGYDLSQGLEGYKASQQAQSQQDYAKLNALVQQVEHLRTHVATLDHQATMRQPHDQHVAQTLDALIHETGAVGNAVLGLQDEAGQAFQVHANTLEALAQQTADLHHRTGSAVMALAANTSQNRQDIHHLVGETGALGNFVLDVQDHANHVVDAVRDLHHRTATAVQSLENNAAINRQHIGHLAGETGALGNVILDMQDQGNDLANAVHDLHHRTGAAIMHVAHNTAVNREHIGHLVGETGALGNAILDMYDGGAGGAAANPFQAAPPVLPLQGSTGDLPGQGALVPMYGGGTHDDGQGGGAMVPYGY